MIGTDITGTTALPNFEEGVVLDSADNTVGGSTAGAGNLISSNLTRRPDQRDRRPPAISSRATGSAQTGLVPTTWATRLKE